MPLNRLRTLQTNYNKDMHSKQIDIKILLGDDTISKLFSQECSKSQSTFVCNNTIILSFSQQQIQKRNVLLNNTEHNDALCPVDKGLFRRQYRFQTHVESNFEW